MLLLCYTLVSVLVSGIGIATGKYYWILGAFLGIVLTLIEGICNIYSMQDCPVIPSVLYLN